MSQDNSNSVSYRVSLLPSRHELQVEVTLKGEIATGNVLLQIPTWVPGDYAFAPQARDLFEVSARDANNQPLTVRREGWQGWRVEGGTGVVVVTYSASAWGDDLSESAGLVSEKNAVILGARYLHTTQWLGPCRVRYELPPDWAIHHPSGATRIGDTAEWEYPSYELLLDTPVILGHFDVIRKNLDNTAFYFVFLDRGVGFTTQADRFANAVVKATETFHRMFGQFPFTDYTFILSLSPDNDWGLEHLTSTMCGLGPNVFVDEDDFKIGVRVCAHELFHAWNVRRCRPSPLGELEKRLESGAFTEGLWVAEGFTRYYEFLSCARAGVYSASEFFSNLIGYYEHLTAQPAYERVSVTESSYTSFLNHAKYAGRVNNSIDYYDKGMLIAFALDTELRTLDKPSSLDEAFKSFYEKFAGYGDGNLGYTTQDAIDFFSAHRPQVAKRIAEAVLRPGGLQTPLEFKKLGFTVTSEEVSILGLVFQGDVTATIYGVLDTSAAGEAGLAPGDELVAIDGYAFSKAALTWAAKQPQPMTLTVTRGHQSLFFTLTPKSVLRVKEVIWEGTEAQREVIHRWLGVEPDFTRRGQCIDLGFYENFHGVEIVI